MKMKGKVLLGAALMLMGIGVGVLAGCGQQPQEEEVVTTDLLRIGVLSDVHVGFHSDYGQSDRLEKALLFYKNKGVDGVIIAGDLQEHTGSSLDVCVQWVEEFTDIWFRVFPDNTNDFTGEHVEPLFIYGNHDTSLVDAEYWPERLGEFEEAWIREVKGYQFVGAHYTKEGTDTAANLCNRADSLSKGKPFFFIQHQPIMETLYNANSGLLGTGAPMYDVLKRYENCVVFSGHTHIPITDERSIWQSNKKKNPQFTAVNCATINYGWLKGYGTLDINGNADDTQQGMYMTVDGSIVTLERYSFYDMELIYESDKTRVDMSLAESLGEPWVIDATQKKNRPYDYETRAENACKPVFPEGAELDVGSTGKTYVNVFIPAASVDAPEGFSDIIQSYYLEAVDVETGEVVATSEVASVHHVDLDDSRMKAEAYLGLDGLSPGKTYELRAYARESFQICSDPLIAQVTTPTE